MQHSEMMGHMRVIAGHGHYFLKAKVVVPGPLENKYHMNEIPPKLADVHYFPAWIGNADHRFTRMYRYRSDFLKLMDKVVKKLKRIVRFPA